MSAPSPRPGDPLAAYVDALLASPEASALEYWLVEAGGIVFAVAADEARPTDAEAGRRVVDLAAAALGRASPPRPLKLLELSRAPGIVLGVDAVDGLVEVAPDRVSWRASASGGRPWLAGMLSEPRAAVVSIGDLVEEA